MTILIIEDDPSNRIMLGAFIKLIAGEDAQVEILEAESLDDAMRLLPRADAVLCDGQFPLAPRGYLVEYNQPREHWVEIAGWAKKKGVPFVVLTGDADISERVRAAGYAAFNKPLEAKAAVQAILDLAIQQLGNLKIAKSPDGEIAQCLDDPRFTNGRRTGCISPNDEEQGSGVRDQGLGEETSSTPNPESPTPNPCSLPDATGEPYVE